MLVQLNDTTGGQPHIPPKFSSVPVFVTDWKVIVTTQEKIEAFLFSY
jgi:hypothetical protein